MDNLFERFKAIEAEIERLPPSEHELFLDRLDAEEQLTETAHALREAIRQKISDERSAYWEGVFYD